MLKAKDLRDQSLEELEANCEEAKKALYLLKNEKMRNRRNMEKPHRPAEKKKEIARLLTIIHEKRLAAEQRAT